MRPIQADELYTPHLNLPERQALLLALNTSLFGLGEVTVGFLYDKQTDTAPRIQREDYIPIPGVDPKCQFGQIVKVARCQKDGSVYFKLATMTRGDGTNPRNFANVRPEGIHEFTITGFQPAAEIRQPEIAQ